MTAAHTASAALPGGCVQTVAPAGAGRETRWVLVTAALVVALSGLVTAWQRHAMPQLELQSHQIDLATALSPDEQGIYTDLQAVHDEWRATGRALPPPTPAHWRDEGWPPFAADLSAQRRGNRQWQAVQAEGLHAYLAQPPAATQDSDGKPARALLWRLPAPQDASAHFQVWLHAAGGPVHPGAVQGLHDDDLIAQGWRLVAAHLGDVQPKH